MSIQVPYFDYQATTPVDPRVRDAMMPYLNEAFGNPSSRTHAYGWQAEMAVNRAREQVAHLLNASKEHIVFTSGATEANNLAILGIMESAPTPGHLIVSSAEHKAVLEVADEVKRRGFSVSFLPVNEYGQVRIPDLLATIRPDTRLISVMWANNEIGSLNPIAEIARIAQEKRIFFHTDAVQAVGRIPINLKEMPITALSFSGHKLYAPKGVGALFIRRDLVTPRPQTYGGSQEWGLRPGTLNVPGIVALGKACAIAEEELPTESKRLTILRQKIWDTLRAEFPGVILNGHPTERLPGNLSLSFPNLKSDLFSLGLTQIACSSGSACTSGQGRSSHVLSSIGMKDDQARATVRLGLGRYTTDADVHTAIEHLLAIKRNNDVNSNI